MENKGIKEEREERSMSQGRRERAKMKAQRAERRGGEGKIVRMEERNMTTGMKEGGKGERDRGIWRQNK